MSTTAIRSYIKQNPTNYTAYFSDLIESFLFMSSLRWTVILGLLLSNVSNFSRTQDVLSLLVNVPSELLLLLYPTLRKKKIIPRGQGSLICFVLILLLSLQWSFSFWVFVKNDVQVLGPTVVTIVLSVLWVFAMGPSVPLNILKASICTLLFVGSMYAINADYVLNIKGSLIVGLLLGIGLNQAMDQMLRFRFYIEHQQVILLEKNAKIELIMQASHIIMFAIDERQQIHAEFKADMARLFGQGTGSVHLDGFLSRTELSTADKTAMKSALEAMLGDNVVGFEMNENALAKRFRLQTASEGWRTVMASYAPLLNHDGRIQEILLAINDVTEVENQELRQKQASMESESLLILLRAPREQLNLFMQESQNILLLLQEGTGSETLLRSLHTFKGNCRMLGFKSLAQLIHETEDALQTRLGFDDCCGSIQSVLNLLLSVYNERFQPAHEPIDFKVFVEQLAQRSAEQISESLGKPTPLIHVTCSTQIDHAALRQLMFQVLPHLIANALDHGIESAAERTAMGKSRHGNIYMDFSGQGTLQLRFRDDGRGLALDALRQQLNKPDITDSDVAERLFNARQSTRSVVSEISGRGVGLNAVAEAVRARGGEIGIILGDFAGPGYRNFTIELQVPMTARVLQPA